MVGDKKQVLDDIYNMLEMVLTKQDKLLEEIKGIKEIQKKIQEEMRLSNFVLNNITLRNEILN